ncbi:MAG: molybdopterin molybdotransferase MoeA [Gemmatimonadetes bacterium]|nr:molybdopterin molybdotransferase MoeA [Gemmatimonadota bacterium]
MAERRPPPADWLSLAAAQEHILLAVKPLPLERVSLLEASGRVLAEEIHSPIDQPPWDNSAMDGFAVRAADVRGASREQPVELELLEEVPAGGFATRSVGPGQAIKIMTGAPLPAGADCVVRLEHTDAWDGGQAAGKVAVFSDSDAGRNVRRRGEDLRAGAAVLEPGRLLRPAELGVLASLGRAMIRVHRKPRVAILSNGNELAELDEFHEVLAGRKIVNSNSYALAAAVLATGCQPLLLGTARDDEASLRAHLEGGLDADVLVTTAGASVGEHDLVKEVLLGLGLELDFWRVRIRPGSPFSFGRLGRLAVFGLPGNPVSALVTFEVLVRPALRRMLGRRAVHNRTLAVRAAERITSRPGLTRFLRATLEQDEAGGWRARLTGPQGSGMLSSMAQADALLVLPEDVEVVEAGAALVAMPLAPSDDAQAQPGLPTAAATFSPPAPSE